ncbi:unnamed protein product [Porites lobata]|uniref:Ferritin n=1 Tax=Porites lobata TaxID=104759 RepID=A0ABN8RAB4_9CNID|nr:unnamed protein product [Porites lobata]
MMSVRFIEVSVRYIVVSAAMYMCLFIMYSFLSVISSTVNPLLLIQAMHFNRDDINLPGFHKFFLESAEEEMKHAQKFMKYQNMRGGRVKLHHIMKPYENHWGNGLGAMTHAYHLELEVYQALVDIHKKASDDPQFQDFLESEFLGEQVESIKELSNHINTLKRFSEQNYALGEYQFDKVTLGGESKE